MRGIVAVGGENVKKVLGLLLVFAVLYTITTPSMALQTVNRAENQKVCPGSVGIIEVRGLEKSFVLAKFSKTKSSYS